jgi:hypothetical protein
MPVNVPVVRRLLVGLAVTACVASAGGSALARPVAPSGWRTTKVLGLCGSDSLGSVIALSPDEAWAVGQPNFTVSCSADVEQWNGRTWRRLPVPRELQLLGFGLFSIPIAATSSADLWIFPTNPDQPFHNSDYALHFDGKGWRKSRFPMTFEVTDAADFGRRDVWAFGQGRYVARYNGKSWRKGSMPVTPLAVSALSATDIWAIGPTARNRLAAVNWSGRRWQPVPLPRLSRADAPGNLSPGDITATGPGDLWWTYRPSSGSRSARLLHYQNGRWTTIAVPGQVTEFGPITPDGHGGVWMLGETGYDLNQYWYHYNDGRWGRRSVIAPRGYNLGMSGLALVPGTTSVWSVGEADKNYPKTRGPITEAVIARYGN